MQEVKIKAYGKINLGLDVVGLYPNGYHEVNMVMQNVGIFDTLCFKKNADGNIRLSTNTGVLPTDDNNLIVKAVKMLQKEFGITQGFDIFLEKKLPIAAGMAGGSSDAAAAIKAVNMLCDLNLTLEELMRLGAEIGADVPYCIMGGTALARGIGEILSPLPDMPACHVLLVKPGIAVSTPFVYKTLDTIENPVHPDIEAVKSALAEKDITKLCSVLGNILEEVTIPIHPVISDIKNKMLELGALGSLMSGSGPTVFGIFTESVKAKQAYEYFKATEFAGETYLTCPVNPEEKRL